MACSACHKAKVKCDRKDDGNPCSRCRRLGIECIQHKSRQGQGKKGRKKRRRNETDLDRPEDAAAQEKRDTAAQIFKKNENSKIGPNHYGFYFLVRQWISFSITRRSFGLLAKAAALSKKFGITMDEVLCGTSRYGPVSASMTGAASNSESASMGFLQRILLQPEAEQQVYGPRLQLHEVPLKLLQAIHCCPSLTKLNDRWILIREMQYGMSRYFVSPKFEQDIASYDLILKTWRENKKEVADLWTHREEDKYKHTQGLIHQISLQKTASVVPAPARICDTRITLASGEVVAVDYVVCFVIMDVDTSVHYIEYSRRRPDARSETSGEMKDITEVSSVKAETNLDSLDLDKNLEFVDELEWTSDLDCWLDEMKDIW